MSSVELRKKAVEAELREAESVLVGVCAVVGIGVRDVQGRSRTRETAEKRAVVAWVLGDRLKWARSKVALAIHRTPRQVKSLLKKQRVTSPAWVK